jgi:hypothetical protein
MFLERAEFRAYFKKPGFLQPAFIVILTCAARLHVGY